MCCGFLPWSLRRSSISKSSKTLFDGIPRINVHPSNAGGEIWEIPDHKSSIPLPWLQPTASTALRIPFLLPLLLGSVASMSEPKPAFADTTPLNSDEIEINITGNYIGLSLTDVKYKESLRVRIDDVKSDAEEVLNKVRPGYFIVSVNGASVEGLSRVKIAEKIKEASRPLRLVFRDPKLFVQQLNTNTFGDLTSLSTQVLPTSNQYGGRPPQIIRVTRVNVPATTSVLRSKVLKSRDVVEVVYEAYDVDGKKIGGMKNFATDDTTAYFVIGSDTSPQIYNKPPPPTTERKSTPLTLSSDDEIAKSLEMSLKKAVPKIVQQLMVGMCVGETRRIEVPAVLQEGQTDFTKPNVVYVVRLISINGEI